MFPNRSPRVTGGGVGDGGADEDREEMGSHPPPHNPHHQHQHQHPHHQHPPLPDEDTEAVLSKALLRLSVTDRNAIEEEIHGVTCLCPEETPHYVRDKVLQLRYELQYGTALSSSDKWAYRQQQQQFFHTLGGDGARCQHRSQHALLLHVLRCELFDVPKAGRSLCAFCTTFAAYFACPPLPPIRSRGSIEPSESSHTGTDTGAAPAAPSVYDLQLTTHFTKKEISLMRKGLYQYLPFRDRSGRRVCVCFPGTETIQLDSHLVIKMLLYFVLIANTETQRKGYVVIVWYREANFDSLSAMLEISRRATVQMLSMKPLLRTVALHICTPDTPFFRLRRSLPYASAMIREINSRIRFHVGTPLELLYALKGYGIPVEVFPLSSGGTIKTASHIQWLVLRQEIETRQQQQQQQEQQQMEQQQQQQQQQFAGMNSNNSGIDNIYTNNNSSHMNCNSNNQELVIVECPGVYDVVFRKGKTFLNNPGNMYYQTIIEEIFEEQHAMKTHAKTTTTTTNSKKLTMKELSSKVIRCIEQEKGGRFLEWINDLDDSALSVSSESHSATAQYSNTTTNPPSIASGTTSSDTTEQLFIPPPSLKPKSQSKPPVIVSCWVQIHDYDQIRIKIIASFKRYRLRREAGTVAVVPILRTTGEGGRSTTAAATSKRVASDATTSSISTAAAIDPAIIQRPSWHEFGLSSSTMATQLMAPSSCNVEDGNTTPFTSGFSQQQRGHSVLSTGENNTNSNSTTDTFSNNTNGSNNNNSNNNNEDTTFMFMNKRQKYTNDKTNNTDGFGCFGNCFQ